MPCRLIGTAQTLVCGGRSPIALPRREFLRGAAAAMAFLAVSGIVPARRERRGTAGLHASHHTSIPGTRARAGAAFTGRPPSHFRDQQ